MLFYPLLRRPTTTLLHLTTASTLLTPFRAVYASTMAQPPSNFTLDRAIFNPDLYQHLRTFWFADTPPSAGVPSFPTLRAWFGVGYTPAEVRAHDAACRDHFVHALEALGPGKLELPKWDGWDAEVENAREAAGPLLGEVEAAQRKYGDVEGERKGAEVLLSLVLLLDQMPRNIYREPEGLGLVYNHYDRLAFSLVRSALALERNPLEAKCYERRPMYTLWMLMPMLHSEHLASHAIYQEHAEKLKRECGDEASGDEEERKALLEYVGRAAQAQKDHVVLIERFGRYPHRNEYVGRASTKEEEEFLVDGESFGVKKAPAKAKDEL